MSRLPFAAGLLSVAVCLSPAKAQTPPSAAELASYDGLHSAAAKGSINDVKRLAHTGSDLDERDDNVARLFMWRLLWGTDPRQGS